MPKIINDHYEQIDYDTDELTPQMRKHPKCKRCQCDALLWLMVKGKWRLCDNETGAPHRCPPAAAAKDDFKHLGRKA